MRRVAVPLLALAFAVTALVNVLYAPAAPEPATAPQHSQQLQPTPRSPKGFHFVTILSEPRKFHCTMLASVALLNITVHVFGWGDSGLHGVVGWWRKLLWFKALLRTFDDDDIVVFFDAGDSLLNKPAHAVKEAYELVVAEQRLQWEHEFVWSAEKNCGMKTLTKEQCKNLHRINDPSPYRWLNTGGWAGRVKTARHIFATADRVRAGRRNDADQSFVAEAHVKHGWKNLHGIDYKQRVFMSVYKGWKDLCGWSEGSLERPLRNCVTGTRPAVFHFNAGAKDERIWNPVQAGTEWAAELATPDGASRVRAHEVVVNGRPVAVGRICPTGFGLVGDADVAKVRRLIDLGAAERSHINPGG